MSNEVETAVTFASAARSWARAGGHANWHRITSYRRGRRGAYGPVWQSACGRLFYADDKFSAHPDRPVCDRCAEGLGAS